MKVLFWLLKRVYDYLKTKNASNKNQQCKAIDIFSIKQRSRPFYKALCIEVRPFPSKITKTLQFKGAN